MLQLLRLIPPRWWVETNPAQIHERAPNPRATRCAMDTALTALLNDGIIRMGSYKVTDRLTAHKLKPI